jgi:hypothetical protein
MSKIEESEPTVMPYTDRVLYDNFVKEVLLETLSNHFEAPFSPVYIGNLRASIRWTYIPKFKSKDQLELGSTGQVPKDCKFKSTQGGQSLVPSVIGKTIRSLSIKSLKNIYHLLLKTKSSATYRMGIGDLLPRITKTKNILGEWVEIERRLINGSATGLTELSLPPNDL